MDDACHPRWRTLRVSQPAVLLPWSIIRFAKSHLPWVHLAAGLRVAKLMTNVLHHVALDATAITAACPATTKGASTFRPHTKPAFINYEYGTTTSPSATAAAALMT